jgi:(2Fe-2S) ferredoxin
MASAPADPKPYYDHHVFVCVNRREPGHRRGCCAEKDSESLRDYMKAKAKAMGIAGIRVNSAGCLDRCELGPNMVIYPEGVWYRPTSFADVDEILETHLRQGGRVERLMLKPEDGPAKG